MDFRFDRIRDHIEHCFLDACVFERTVEGAQLFDVDIITKGNAKWLVIAAGITDSEFDKYLINERTRDRAKTPIQIQPTGELKALLIIRPVNEATNVASSAFVDKFSSDVGAVELYQGCYIRVDGLQNPAIHQIRWELDLVDGHKPPKESWLRPWATLVGCNPAHAPSHWHINSPPIEMAGRRGKRHSITPPELRLATGTPNPLLFLLSLSNWLRETI
jgi:hypothetical protein